MILLYTLLVLIFPAIIFLNMLTYRMVVKKALRKYIEPKLTEQGLLFVEYKWPGLLSKGDFKNENFSFTIMNRNGRASFSSYADIFYKRLNDTKKVTVRIDTTFLIINKVSYSSEF